MATLIKTDGTKKTVFPKNKRRGFTLQEVYDLLNIDMVQVVPVNNGAEELMLCDEEAKIKEGWFNRLNEEATRIFDRSYGVGRDVIIGDVLMCTCKEWK